MALIRFKKGLSFIEVMYSILLLSSAVAILSQISSQSSQYLDRAKRYHLISELMEKKLTELEIEFQKEGPSVLQDSKPQKFEDHSGFSWSLKTKNAPLTHFQNLSKDEDFSSQAEETTKKFILKISELVIEVQLTIHFSKFGKTASYPITTYFIDFQKSNSLEFVSDVVSAVGGASLLQGTGTEK